MYMDIDTYLLKDQDRTVLTEIGDSNNITSTRKLRTHTNVTTDAAATKKTKKARLNRD